MSADSLIKKIPRRSRKRAIRYGLLTANFIILALVSAFVVVGRHNSNPASPQATNQSLLSTNQAEAQANPLDQLSSADIAVHIARVAALPEASGVTEKADTVNAQLTVSSTDQEIVSKPQVVSAGLKSRKDIQKYTVKQGDTVASIAAQFGVTSDTIRWSNGVTGDAVAPGKQLLISPVNGIIYTVKQGDTAESIASKYQSNKDLLVAINDAEIGGLPVGQSIIIPDGRPAATGGRATLANLAASGGFAWGGFSPVYGSNGYDYGYCTWWAAVRRQQIGHPVPSNLGNASTWKVLAQRAGLAVGNRPAAGAVIWTPPRDYYGHVGFVESVDPDGTVHVSEMNVAGWGRVSSKTLSPDQAAAYGYIY